MAKWIIPHMPEHRVYVEPFCGAANVLMQKPRSHCEVINDLDDRVVNVFRVLRDADKASKLRQQIQLTPYSRTELRSAFEDTTSCDIERARRLIARSFLGRSGTLHQRTGLRVAGTAYVPPEKNFANYEAWIPEFTKRLAGVVVENLDAMELMRRWDSPDTLYYVDPPYTLDSRKDKSLYRFELPAGGQETLIELLRGLSGMVLLSGYPNPLYDQLGWHCETLEVADRSNDVRTECLWINPAAVSKTKNQLELQL